MKKFLSIVWVAGYCLMATLAGFGITVSTLIADAVAQSLGVTSAVVFACDGRFMKVDVASGQVVASGTAGDVAPGTRKFDGCLIDDVRVDSRTGRIYAVLPKELVQDQRGRRHYRVVALDADTLKIASTHEIPEALEGPPRIVLDSMQQNLLVNYVVPREAWQASKDIVQRYSIPGFGVSVNTAPAKILLAARDPFIDSRGVIVDGRTTYESDGSQREEIDGYALLNETLKRKFADLVRVGRTGNRFLDISFADSAGGRMAFVLAWDMRDNRSPAGGGVVVYDIAEKRVVSSFHAPYPVAPFEGAIGTPTVHLTSDGSQVVVESSDWLPPQSGSPGSGFKRVKTGKFAIFNADTGALVGSVDLGFRRWLPGWVIGFSDDGKHLYYSSHETLYLVDLASVKVSSTVALPQGFLPIAVKHPPQW
jgi:hypothetical protein